VLKLPGKGPQRQRIPRSTTRSREEKDVAIKGNEFWPKELRGKKPGGDHNGNMYSKGKKGQKQQKGRTLGEGERKSRIWGKKQGACEITHQKKQ